MLPRGVRDFPPKLMKLRMQLIETARRIFTLYGYEEMDTPAIELWEVLKGKYGEEAEKKLVFRFVDELSKKQLALRYDLTVPLMRFMATRGRALPLPFKRFQIGKVWRHDEPQRGRYREFLQADADVVGSRHPLADSEILEVFSRFFKVLNLDFKVHLNHRATAVNLAEKYFKEPIKVLRIVDKADKIGMTKVKELLQQFGDAESYFKELESIEVPEELDEIVSLLPAWAKKHVVFDPFLVRGLDYYTGMIFEIKIPSSGFGTFSAGGRYDSLGRLFGMDLPAVGGSIGIDRLLDYLLAESLLPVAETSRVYIVNLGASTGFIAAIREELFKAGVASRVDLKGRSWKKQIEEARKLGYSVLIFAGPKEEASSRLSIETPEGKYEVPLDELSRLITRILQ